MEYYYFKIKYHCNIYQNCVSKCTRSHLSAYSCQKISEGGGGGSMLPDPSRKLVAFGPSGLLPQNDIKSEIEPCLHVSAVA